MRVGTRTIAPFFFTTLLDHPHACGDKDLAVICKLCSKGSSPCVWGQELKKLNSIHTSRIIPMRVGTSYFVNGAFRFKEDHPHACGDKTKEIKENSGFAKSTA